MKTLVGAEWTLVLRDRRAFLAGIALVFLVTLVPHMAHHWLVDLSGLGSRSLEALDSPVIDESVAVSGAVGWAVEGPRPPWLAEAAGSGAPPEALVRFWTEDGGQSGVHFDVLGLFPGARLDAVADAVKEAGFQERQKRAEAVGLVGPWKEVLDLEFLEPPVAPVPFRWPKVPLGAALVLLAGAMASLSWIMDTVPRARTGGWLESLAVLPLGRVRVIHAWLFVAGSLSLIGMGVGYAGHLLGSGLSGQGGLGPTGWLIPVATLLLVPPQVLAFLTASDLRAAVMRSMWVLPGSGLLVAVAMGLVVTHPGWVPWVPVGGLVVACLGLMGPGSLALTVGLAGVLAWGCTRACVAVLEGPGAEVRGVGRVAERRARGNWFPEVALLVALGIAAVVAWSPGLWGEDVVRVLLTSHLVFYALPALLAPRLLGLSPSELLPRRWPGWWVMGLSALGVGATLGFALFASLAQQAWMPLDPIWIELIERTTFPVSGVGRLFLLALLPGICEEMLFRGAVLGLLRKGMPAGWAVWVQAALFSLAHLYGFRLLPTFGVGLATGWLVLRTGSLLPAVLLHTLHNALAVSQGSELALDLGDPSTVGALVGMVLVGLLALVLAGRGEGRS